MSRLKNNQDGSRMKKFVSHSAVRSKLPFQLIMTGVLVAGISFAIFSVAVVGAAFNNSCGGIITAGCSPEPISRNYQILLVSAIVTAGVGGLIAVIGLYWLAWRSQSLPGLVGLTIILLALLGYAAFR